ncbi:MAG TPA: TIGR03936 family radical SAM-associated protein, partial [Candidatus Krumholzibacteria bacterium]|nr:TIGR03936 family radical SAM-associated protein [Candidatus Krumholzibacteria bacterium]
DRIGREKPSSFTFAPEAGSQRLRDVINKNITEDDVVTTAGQALRAGVKTVKLYFMIGLPTETNEDLDELVALVGRVVGLAPRGGAQVHVSISPFSPKAHTTFQWAGQIAREEIERRNQYLEKRLRRLKVKVSLRDPSVSALEGILGLGDAALAPAVVEAWRQGARFDGWDEHFHFATWERAFAAVGVDPAAYLAPRDPQAPLPWDSVDCGVDRSFLAKDWHRAQRAATLHDCRLEGSCYNCAACDGDIQHIFAKLEALQAEAPGDQVEGPAVVADRDDPAEVPSFDPRNADPEDPAQEAAKWRAWRHQAAAKCWYRVEYRKTGDLIFLGHLDFQRQFQLALRRSGLPAAYSKGYHPHPLMRFGPPLPVGVAGERECLDIAFEGQVPGWVQRLNAELPADLMIRRAVVIGGQAPAAIDQLVERFDYRVQLPPEAWGGPDAGTVAAAIDGFLASASWPCVRRRAKGDLEIDARVLVPTGGLALEPDPAGDGAPVLRVTLLRGDGGVILPVHDFLAALLGEALAEPRFSAITRTGIHGRQQDGRWLSPVEEVGESGLRTWLARQHAD